MSSPDLAEFDRWYAVLARSAGFAAFVAERLELPSSLVTTGFLGGAGLTEIDSYLGLGPEDVLVDLGCGRAGHSLALVRDTGARLVGVDFSAVALSGAEADASAYGMEDRATFRTADLAATGLPDRSATAVVCLDALQFATSAPAVLAECRRILVPGGRIAVSSWQADPTAEEVPARIRRMDLARDLPATGFTDVAVLARPEWSAAEVRLWTAALQHDPGDDAGLQELRSEAAELLPLAGSLRRVLAVGRRPA